MKVKIIKPDSTLYDGEASVVDLPGTGGRFEILNDHAPIISSLRHGTLRIVTAEGEKSFEIRGGVIKGEHNDLTILVQ